MQTSQHSRRNFLSSIAILSAGAAFGSTAKHLPSFSNEENDLQKRWKNFWKKSGGVKCYTFENLQQQNQFCKGHFYKNGETILFPRENIIALPTWIFWKKNSSEPADAVITLFENNDELKKLGRLNRFELDALYKLSRDNYDEDLLSAQCNNLKPVAGNTAFLLKNKISVAKNSHTHEVSYFRQHELVLNKKFIYHS